jgi:hypothetical protein
MASRKIDTTIVGKKTPKPHITYPMIRFPQECQDLIGTRVDIFEIENGGRSGYLVVPSRSCTTVVQRRMNDEGIFARCEALAHNIENPHNGAHSENKRTSCHSGSARKEGKTDGPVRIRTGDLRRVRATS